MGGIRAKTVSMTKRKVRIKAERKRIASTPNQLGIQKAMALARITAKAEAVVEAKKLKAASKKKPAAAPAKK